MVACCSRFLLTVALLLTSSHLKAALTPEYLEVYHIKPVVPKDE